MEMLGIFNPLTHGTISIDFEHQNAYGPAIEAGKVESIGKFF